MSHTFDSYGESSPMMMGSPNSPASPHQSQFLPGFLLGETSQHAGSPSTRLWSAVTSPSPPKSAHRGSNITSPLSASYITSPGPRETIRPKERPGAPPTKSLMSYSSPSTASPFATSFHQTPSRGFHTPGTSACAPPLSGLSSSIMENMNDTSQFHLAANTKLPPSPAQMDPFYTQGESLTSEDILDETWITVFGFPPAAASFILQQFFSTPSRGFHTPGTSACAPPLSGLSSSIMENMNDTESLTSEDILDETWITVFGFPPAAASFILQQFSQYGNIVKHVIATEGNWMHLHYQSKLQAKKALSKNGRMFAGNIMVGVTPCIDKSVMEDKENPSFSGTPVLGLMDTPVTSKGTPGTSKGTPIRPLTAAYKSARSENDVVRNNQVPQKSNTFASKAMEYMFGW
ncbi:NUP35 [Mytilus edulis]|uniref:Nucleoporin NUP35 n=1 Tax=Mytilus edulis TaxID=6550 RepID=A0A8S3UF64_MYTED|nr:NUP35 [Mytilus edulis]